MISMIQFAKNIRKQLLAITILSVATPLLAATLDGYVTKVDSQTKFNVGTLHVLLDPQTLCSTATSSTPKVKYSYRNRFFYSKHPASKEHVKCNDLKLEIGSKIYVIGEQTKDHGFLAKQLIDYLYVDASGNKIHGSEILEEEPKILHKTNDWNGTLWVDGYPIAVTRHATIQAEKNNLNIHYRWLRTKSDLYPIAPESKENDTLVPPCSLLRENRRIVYDIAYMQDGNLAATALRLWPNYVDAKEKIFLKSFSARIVDPDYKQHIPGSIHFSRHLSYRDHTIGIPFNRHLFGHKDLTLTILPDQNVQNWISALGMELVPQYQKILPDTDASKVHFHFYVVSRFGKLFNSYLKTFNGIEFKSRDGAVFIAMPNGIIIIADDVLANIRNKSQLVANMEYAISSVLQKQLYIQWLADIEDPNVLFSYVAYRREQALRLGIRQMYLAGYDIREAPFAWAVAQGKPVQNPIINSKHPDQEIPWYAAYAFNYISHYYSDVDYSKLKRGEHEYQQFLQELYKADPSLPRPQAQLEPQASPQPQAAAQPVLQSSPAAPTASAPRAASPVASSSATLAITHAH